MKSTQIIKELIRYGNGFGTPFFLKSKEKELDSHKLNHIISDLLFWQKTIFRSNSRGKILDMSLFNQTQYFMRDYDISVYKSLLENEELNMLFIIKGDAIILNPLFTENEILEIRQIIEKDYEVILHISPKPKKGNNFQGKNS